MTPYTKTLERLVVYGSTNIGGVMQDLYHQYSMMESEARRRRTQKLLFARYLRVPRVRMPEWRPIEGVWSMLACALNGLCLHESQTVQAEQTLTFAYSMGGFGAYQVLEGH